MSGSTNRFLRQANLVGGEWIKADSGETFNVTNPATGKIIGTVPKSGRAETRRAIEAASAAFATFRKTTARERADMLCRLFDLIMKHQTELARLLVAEQGKPLAEALAEIAISAHYVRWFAEEARRVYGEIIPSPWPGRQLQVVCSPVGVIAAITPWNFPSSMLARKIGPAIAAGCTSVVKPAGQTPYSALAWGVLADEAGIPDGVVNIITGRAGEIGDELCENPAVRKITFTGSTEVGKVLLEKAAGTVKKMSMELGGNAPFIVFDDADLDLAVRGAMISKYRNSGQTCVCANRLYVQSGIHDRFVEALVRATRAIKVANGMEEGAQQGPLIDARALEQMDAFIADARACGGEIVLGGKRHALGEMFFEPTVITGATHEMRFAREEIFGPIAPVYKFETEEEAVNLANDSEYGLACYFYSRDLGRVMRVMHELEYGLIGVNEGLITTPEAPFGGLRESGLGKEGGRQGIADYLNSRYISLGGWSGEAAGAPR